MYSPKIREDIVIKLYHIAKQKRMAMTKLVNHILSIILESDTKIDEFLNSEDSLKE